ncbi:uncharacterized protein LOC110623909 [Manihot esculenta]|uniref:Uncharacterized protein n=1 Tax=Manihot esculenta TaxID=3983 RepID=A0ACB7H138_MANES|nr:uncharacterized protein LOC110623909 [Manihot esculenta]KAG8645936.1 hypothetical protein MANES_10G108350v8 [Manihot esculenta]
MGSSITRLKLLLLLMLIIDGTIPSSLGVELESLASKKGRFDLQGEGKSNTWKKSYLRFEDHVKRNHMRENFRSKHENIQTALAFDKTIDANFRHNHMIMRRLLQKGASFSKPIPCHYTTGKGSCSPSGGRG